MTSRHRHILLAGRGDRTGPWRLGLSMVALLALSSGCTSSIVFSSSYLAGIELTPGANDGQQRAKVALQKSEGVMMPGCSDETTLANWMRRCEKILPKAYSTLAFSDLDTGTLLLGGLTNVRIVQVFATGRAANEAAKSGSAKDAFLKIEATPDDTTSSRCVKNWLGTDGTTSPERLESWWKEHGMVEPATETIAGQGYDERREELIKDLGIQCP